jgi:hypothetical protein
VKNRCVAFKPSLDVLEGDGPDVFREAGSWNVGAPGRLSDPLGFDELGPGSQVLSDVAFVGAAAGPFEGALYAGEVLGVAPRSLEPAAVEDDPPVAQSVEAGGEFLDGHPAAEVAVFDEEEQLVVGVAGEARGSWLGDGQDLGAVGEVGGELVEPGEWECVEDT